MPGRPFEPGNTFGKGRPPGSRNNKTIFQEALESHGVEIINQIKLQALKPMPHPTILVRCLERLVPVCKLPNSRFELPKVETAADLPKAFYAVAQAVAQGQITAYEGEAIARILESQGRMFDEDFEKRLRALAEKKDKE